MACMLAQEYGLLSTTAVHQHHDHEIQNDLGIQLEVPVSWLRCGFNISFDIKMNASAE